MTWIAKPCYLEHIQLFLVNDIRRLQKPSITLCLCLTHAPPTANIISRITTSDLRESASKARKSSTPWPWNCGSRGPKFGSQIWAQTEVHADPETVSQNLTFAVFRLLSGSKTSPENGPIFGHARRRHGAGKRVHFGSPHRSLEFTPTRFSQPPISTPQQLSSGLRYTRCDANLGNSHRSINLKPMSKTPNMLLCFHSRRKFNYSHSEGLKGRRLPPGRPIAERLFLKIFSTLKMGPQSSAQLLGSALCLCPAIWVGNPCLGHGRLHASQTNKSILACPDPLPPFPLQATLEDTDSFHMIKTRSMYLLRTLPNTLATLVAVSTFRAQPAQLCLQGERGNHGSGWQQAFHQDGHSYMCYI